MPSSIASRLVNVAISPSVIGAFGALPKAAAITARRLASAMFTVLSLPTVTCTPGEQLLSVLLSPRTLWTHAP